MVCSILCSHGILAPRWHGFIPAMATPTVLTKVLSLGHQETFHCCVERHRGDAYIKSFSCYDRWLLDSLDDFCAASPGDVIRRNSPFEKADSSKAQEGMTSTTTTSRGIRRRQGRRNPRRSISTRSSIPRTASDSRQDSDAWTHRAASRRSGCGFRPPFRKLP
jgi:hypothetical protein